MKHEDLIARKRELELVNNQLWNELVYLDQLMRRVGFSNGLETVKATAEALSDEQEDDAGEAA